MPVNLTKVLPNAVYVPRESLAQIRKRYVRRETVLLRIIRDNKTIDLNLTGLLNPIIITTDGLPLTSRNMSRRNKHKRGKSRHKMKHTPSKMKGKKGAFSKHNRHKRGKHKGRKGKHRKHKGKKKRLTKKEKAKERKKR